MWRAALRHLSHRCRNQQLPRLELVESRVVSKQEVGIWSKYCQCYRFKSSAAALSDGGGVDLAEVDVRWDRQSSSDFGAVALSSPPVLSPLEESVTALDAALHRAVHLPWLANHMWWMQWLSESRTEFQQPSLRNNGLVTPDFFKGSKNFASCAAATQVLDEAGDSYVEKENLLESVNEERFEEREDDRLEDEQSGKLSKERRQASRDRQSLYNRQRKIEISAWKSAADEYKQLVLEMCQKSLAPSIPFVQSLLLGWFEPLKKAIETEQAAIKNLEYKDHRAGYGPYILQLPADMLAVITMHKVMSALMLDWTSSGAAKLVSVGVQIGEAVETEVMIQKVIKRKKKKKKPTDTASSSENADPKTNNSEESKARQKLQENVKGLVKKQRLRIAKNLLQHAEGTGPWSKDIQAKVGCALVQLFLETAFLQSPASQHGDDVGEVRPAFRHYMKSCTGGGAVRMFGVIQCDPSILQRLDKSAQYMAMPYMPMLVKPRKWKGYKKGGHLVLPSTVMRTHGSRQQKEAIEKSSKRMMRKVFDALDSLGSIPWKVNSRILAVIEKIWADGGGLASMVEAADLPLPDKPLTENEYALKRWRSETARVKRINSERYSLRCDTELKLKVAREMLDEDAFYYPHSLDFRGRAYPLHAHLNHLGSDMCRGVLEFAVGRSLGETGFRWLKVHLANVFAGGVDKLSFDDRAAFADQNMDKIFDSAERPLDGRRWWLDAEDPFQCLATCMNIRDAILSGDVTTFVSTLPVHQDGSCNGLQHYAALGRDQNGAEAVNLIAGDKPADVYTGIAMRVRATMEKDAADDPTVNSNVERAKLLLDQIDRKLVKQTVMTSVYGVTFIGARNQIMSRLKERGLGDDSVTFGNACYAAKVTIDALGQMFREAKCIMTWLGDCAKIIACEGEPVRWTTPLGLPVIQPYRKAGRKLVKTALQVLALQHFNDQPVMISRQRSAFPPNFVHSLDGSHMMMTANACKEAGIQFAGVHDSFWTHAGTVEEMNVILRKTFVELYSRPVLEDLLASFKKRFPNVDFPNVPRRGDLELSDVLVAPYFFN